MVDAKALLGESTCWDPTAQCLWWLDIWGKTLHRYEPATGRTQTFATPETPGCVTVRERGGIAIAMGHGFHFFDPSTGRFQHVIDAEAEIPETRMNDGKTDRQGRFWSGTAFEVEGEKAQHCGALYRLDADLTCHKTVTGFACFNGLAWSPDSRTVYFTDSHTPYVWASDFDSATGNFDNTRVFIDLAPTGGICDGATVDAEGCYWLTMPFKSRVQRYDPNGKLMQTVQLSTDTPTCCEFGGKDLDILYVTTATLKRAPLELRDQPWAGGLLAIDVGVKGLPSRRFSG